MKKYFLLFLLVGLFQIFTSCKKDETITDPGEGDSYTPNATGQPMPNFANTSNFNGVMAAISYDFSGEETPGFSMQMGFALMGDGKDAGTIIINNNELGKMVESGKTYYMIPSAANPMQFLTNVSFNNSNHNWSVTGGNGIPALSGTLVSPSAYSITIPVSEALIPRSATLQVTWSNPSSSRIMVFLVSQSGSKYYFAQDQPDNGQHSIPSSILTTFPQGTTILHIIKYKYAPISGSDGKTYIMLAEIVKTVSFVLN